MQGDLFSYEPPKPQKMRMPPVKGYKVKISYYPETCEDFSTDETLTFSNEKNARQFAERQNNLSQVIYAKYIGFR